MAQTKYDREHVRDVLDVLLTRLVQARARRTRPGSEFERLLDGKRGEVHVVLGGILDVSTVVLVDLLRGKRVVLNIALDRMILAALIRERLQQRGAPSARTAQYNYNYGQCF